MQYVTLNDGIQMPLMGYGVFQITDALQCEQCVKDALEVGYRLIDTAAAYQNEEAVGAAIYSSGISREDLFITTKLWIQDAGYESTLKAFDASLQKLGLDYLDLYLIHQPFGDYYGAWRAMGKLQKDGLIRAIGVCNFSPDRLIDLCMNSETTPAVNQIEIHPFYQQNDALKIMDEFGVKPQAWGPLSEGQKNIFNNKLLKSIAAKHERTVAQVILRWHIQRGVIIIPKTVHKERMVENMNIWDFELTEPEMQSIATMDIGHSEIIDHHCWCTATQLNGLKIHE
ncbi:MULTISPECIES: aldo/keto reductase [Blautia]|uniref:aldo/keto reductase n=1 Tax=Blautia TaxID=572511 RepID=UPI000BA380E3|nr:MULTISPECIES: aldo/keto reductase [Blautia]